MRYLRYRIARRRFLRVAAAGFAMALAVGGVSCAAPPAPTSAPAPPTPAAAPKAATPAPSIAAPAASPVASPKPAPPASAAPAKPATLTKWVYSQVPVFQTMYRTIAKEKGFTVQQGLDVEVQNIADGVRMTQGLISGELDAAEVGLTPVFAAADQGAPLKVVAVFIPKLTYILYTGKSINSVKDLIGKNIGSAQAGALLHQMSLAILLAQGIDAAQVNFVNVGAAPDVFRAVVAGKVDAGVAGIEFTKEVEKSDTAKALLSVKEVLPDFINLGLVTTDSVIQKKPEALTRFLAAQGMGYRYALEHRDEAIDLAARITKQDASSMALAFDWYIENKVLDLNFGVPEAGVRYMQELGIKLGVQKNVQPFDKVATNRFRDDALKIIGLHRP